MGLSTFLFPLGFWLNVFGALRNYQILISNLSLNTVLALGLQSEKRYSNLYSHMRERARLPQGGQRSEFCSSWWLPSLNLKTCSGKTKLSLKVSGLCQFYIFWPSVLEENCRQAIALTVEDNLMFFLETTLHLRALTSGQSTGPTTCFVTTACVDKH